ncbi:DUF5590 domain-containing protein [Streptococcus sinensis]|uniref:cell wall elongation regulator TseB-like domain-containing protein n=1 Tax=Streptococcus sinensis TaxID=176090 RepID=UPI001C2E18F3|nr:DUF5590 domain-containing protein [Streptococcus sinensis]
MKHKIKEKAEFPIRQYAIGLFLVLTALVFSFFTVLHLAMEPRRSAMEGSIKVAKEYADLETLTSFSIYNGKESYYSLLGKNSKKVEEGVLISQDSNKIYVYQLQDGISQAEAEQLAKDKGAITIDKITFGYLDGQPVWEIKSGTSYYNIGFESKSLLSKEGL